MSSAAAGADVQRILAAADAFDPDSPELVRRLTSILDEYATILARSGQARQNIGNPTIWPALRRLWDVTSAAHADPDPDDTPRLAGLCVSLARFTRNLVAASPANQQNAFENEKRIRSLIYHYTSFNATQDANSFPATRMLSQTLSNIVTGNDALAQSLWDTYLNLPEEQLVLARLFASPDPRTVLAAFVLVLNCVHDNAYRAERLTSSPRGPRICLTMLDRIASLFEAEDSSEEGRAFDIGYEVFRRVIEADVVAELYGRLAIEGEVVTAHQTTLLKLIDSYLHSSNQPHLRALARRPGDDGSLFDVLTRSFFALSSYTQHSIERAIASGAPPIERNEEARQGPLGSETSVVGGETAPSPPVLQNIDLLLPKVCEALVLVTECLTTVALRAEEAAAAGEDAAGSGPVSAAPSERPHSSPPRTQSPKDILIAATGPSGQGFVENVIEALRLVDAFVPRITYGKVVERPPPPPPSRPAETDAAADTEPWEAPGPASVGPDRARVAGRGGSAASAGPQAQVAKAFAHVKRDLVRLLGIVASGSRAVQDRVRACGGIPVVMNLCVVDDFNPYLREHALFALRNLLDGNAESQAVVDAIKPVGRWDEEKVLRDIRGGAAPPVSG